MTNQASALQDDRNTKRLYSVCQVVATLILSVVWWTVILLADYLKEDGWRILDLGFPLVVCIAAIFALCGYMRRHPFVFSLWLPLAFVSGLLTIMTVGSILPSIRIICHPPTMPAPLEVAAEMLVLVVALVAILVFACCWFVRPKVFYSPIIIITVINIVCIAYYMQHREKVITSNTLTKIQILDSQGKPIQGAELSCQLFGYGPGGSRTQALQSVGSLVTDEKGVIAVNHRKMRMEVIGDVRKHNYREIHFEMGMQFDNDWKERDLKISAKDSFIHIMSKIPAAEQMSFVLYMPKLNEAPQAMTNRPIRTSFTDEVSAARYLDISKASFISNPKDADIQFNFFYEEDQNGYEVPRLRLTGLNGTALFQAPRIVNLTHPLSSFDHVFKRPPVEGYNSSIVVESIQSLPMPSVIFINYRDGTYFAELHIEAHPQRVKGRRILGNIDAGTIDGWLSVNPNGIRCLEPSVESRPNIYFP